MNLIKFMRSKAFEAHVDGYAKVKSSLFNISMLTFFVIFINLLNYFVLAKISYQMPVVDVVDVLNSTSPKIATSSQIYKVLEDIYLRNEKYYLARINECTIIVEPRLQISTNRITIYFKEGFYCFIKSKNIKNPFFTPIATSMTNPINIFQTQSFENFLDPIYGILDNNNYKNNNNGNTRITTNQLIKFFQLVSISRLGIIISSVLFYMTYFFYNSTGFKMDRELLKWWFTLLTFCLICAIFTGLSVISVLMIIIKSPQLLLHLTLIIITLIFAWELTCTIYGLQRCMTIYNISKKSSESLHLKNTSSSEIIGNSCKKTEKLKLDCSSNSKSPDILLESNNRSSSITSSVIDCFEQLKNRDSPLSPSGNPKIRSPPNIAILNHNPQNIDTRSVSAPIIHSPITNSPLSANPPSIYKYPLELKKSGVSKAGSQRNI